VTQKNTEIAVHSKERSKERSQMGKAFACQLPARVLLHHERFGSALVGICSEQFSFDF
jgi:hypothetical protein